MMGYIYIVEEKRGLTAVIPPAEVHLVKINMLLDTVQK
jgi:hypothetical protein